MYTLKDLFEQTVKRHPNREALVCPARKVRWTYREWDRQVNLLASALLDWGLAKGDRVSAFLFNTCELVTALFATAKIGAVFNPINCHLSTAELSYILNDTESRVLIFEGAVKDRVKKALPRLRTVKKLLYVDQDTPDYAESYYQFIKTGQNGSPGVQVSETDWYSIVYTSGTTGRPKGVIHRHREILDHSMCMIHHQKLDCRDRGISVAPLYHVAELHCLFLPRVHVGAANILQHRFEPSEVWRSLANEKITILYGDPVTLEQIAENTPRADLPDLRLILYGASPAGLKMIEKMKKAFGAELMQMYGMAEMGPVVTVLYPEEHDARAGSAGKALLNHEVRVVKPGREVPSDPGELLEAGQAGEILVRGSGAMQGYYKHPERTARAFYGGWYHTGDMGRMDEDGYLWITGRVDDAIITAVDNIYPQEIEEALREHPQVEEVAVVGLPGEGSEKIITAFVVPRSDQLTPEELDNFIRENDMLAAFKIPARYNFVRDLPRTPTGKLIRYLLK